MQLFAMKKVSRKVEKLTHASVGSEETRIFSENLTRPFGLFFNRAFFAAVKTADFISDCKNKKLIKI